MAAKRVPVVVVGAGVSGLTAIKSCLEEGLDVVCYEKNDSIGGLWQYRENGISCMKTTTINASKEVMAFSDFPFPADSPNFMLWSDYLGYLKDYATHFNLYQHIKLDHKVVSIEKVPEFSTNFEWKITVQNTKTNESEEVMTEAIVLCTGFFTNPHMSTFPGLDQFQGRVLHSIEYKHSAGYEDKNVLIVGQGNSAYDIAVELGQVANNVYCIQNPGQLVFGRLGPHGYPYDKYISRYAYWKWEHWSPNDMTKTLLKTTSYDLDLYGLSIENFKPDAHIITISDYLPFCILSGKVKLQKAIRNFTAAGVIFQEQPHKVIPLDVVIMATGYQVPQLPFFQHEVLNKEDLFRGLYKQVFPVRLQHQNVAFICCARYDGSNPCLSEVQSRWVAAVFAKKVSLPDKRKQEAELQTITANPFYNKFESVGKLPIIFPLPYIDEMAQFIGVKPNLFSLFFTDPLLFKAIYFGTFVSYQYRLRGPHSWAPARETIMTVASRMRAGLPGAKEYETKQCKSYRRNLVHGVALLGICGVLWCNIFHNKIPKTSLTSCFILYK